MKKILTSFPRFLSFSFLLVDLKKNKLGSYSIIDQFLCMFPNNNELNSDAIFYQAIIYGHFFSINPFSNNSFISYLVFQ